MMMRWRRREICKNGDFFGELNKNGDFFFAHNKNGDYGNRLARMVTLDFCDQVTIAYFIAYFSKQQRLVFGNINSHG